MAALMLVAVMAVPVGVLVGMHGDLVAVLMAVVAVSLGLVSVFVLVLVFAVATHGFHLLLLVSGSAGFQPVQ